MVIPPLSVEIAFEKNIYDEKNLTVNALTTYKPNEKPPKMQLKTEQNKEPPFQTAPAGLWPDQST